MGSGIRMLTLRPITSVAPYPKIWVAAGLILTGVFLVQPRRVPQVEARPAMGDTAA